MKILKCLAFIICKRNLVKFHDRRKPCGMARDAHCRVRLGSKEAKGERIVCRFPKPRSTFPTGDHLHTPNVCTDVSACKLNLQQKTDPFMYRGLFCLVLVLPEEA